MTLWWKWADEPVKPGLYLCCWGDWEDPRNNLYEVHHFDGKQWNIPMTRQYPMCYAEITHPQEENMLRELNEMI